MLQIVQLVYDDYLKWFDRLSKLLCSFATLAMAGDVTKHQSFLSRSLDQYKAIEVSFFTFLHVMRKVAPALNRAVPDLAPLPLLLTK